MHSDWLKLEWRYMEKSYRRICAQKLWVEGHRRDKQKFHFSHWIQTPHAITFAHINFPVQHTQEVSDSLAEHTINSTCSTSTFHIGLLISQTLAFSHMADTSCDVSTGSPAPAFPDREYQARLAAPELSENDSTTRVTEPQ
ncbi:hypothetical protein B0H11DRAFT_1937403 [Mycena galericulata]|nr:hypothetical protein B0H11DRAFT_1937403 [Mycena galericulata]